MGIFKDENGNSYGDWAHRGQGRTRENANDIVTTGDEKKWYDQTFWIVFFLIVLWPVGLVHDVAQRLRLEHRGEGGRHHRASSAWWCCPTKCPKPCWPLRVPSAK